MAYPPNKKTDGQLSPWSSEMAHMPVDEAHDRYSLAS
jgi:hypothetical protein